ncbi:MAG: lyase family protein, partial [Planctomycetota bacterium]
MRSGRFGKAMDDEMARLNASIGFDQRFYREDIRGSLAWIDGLVASEMITSEERDEIARGLGQVRSEIEAGNFEFSDRLEDIHMNIESRLTDIVGDVGAKLHTGRSRNDQVATDFRLHLREQAREFIARVED